MLLLHRKNRWSFTFTKCISILKSVPKLHPVIWRLSALHHDAGSLRPHGLLQLLSTDSEFTRRASGLGARAHKPDRRSAGSLRRRRQRRRRRADGRVSRATLAESQQRLLYKHSSWAEAEGRVARIPGSCSPCRHDQGHHTGATTATRIWTRLLPPISGRAETLSGKVCENLYAANRQRRR